MPLRADHHVERWWTLACSEHIFTTFRSSNILVIFELQYSLTHDILDIWYTMLCHIFVIVILAYLCLHLFLDLLLFAMWHLCCYCCTRLGQDNRVELLLSSSLSSRLARALVELIFRYKYSTHSVYHLQLQWYSLTLGFISIFCTLAHSLASRRSVLGLLRTPYLHFTWLRLCIII